MRTKGLFTIASLLLMTLTASSQIDYAYVYGLNSQDSLRNVKYKHQIQLIDSLRQYILNDLNMHIVTAFYRTWIHHLDERDSMYIMLYASPKDHIGPPDNEHLTFWHFPHEDSAIVKSNELKANGFETLIYKTAGLSNTQLDFKLVSYPDEAIAFIVLHEATHQHIRSFQKIIPYDYEEALCDAMANKSCISFANKTGMLSKKDVEKQENVFENIYYFMNWERPYLEETPVSDKPKIFKVCNNKIQKWIRNANQFQRDRMGYEVNNAYFFRIGPYSLHYFELQDMLNLHSIDGVIQTVLNQHGGETLKSDEQKVIQIKVPSDSSYVSPWFR